ncbi:hypothetical protein BJ170DRAFT_636590 [Xylariales sp. AK1849]|nr:hypothetical protein BJ170DRAFT_636590 [Xylariales sp. AK1849]
METGAFSLLPVLVEALAAVYACSTLKVVEAAGSYRLGVSGFCVLPWDPIWSNESSEQLDSSSALILARSLLEQDLRST